MSYFFFGTIILLVTTLIFYVVFVSLIYYWREKNLSVVVIPLLFTFEFFVIGFLIVSLISILFQFLPDIVTFLNV